MKKPARLAAIGLGGAIGFVFAVEAAKYVVLGRPLHIIADKEIKQAVAVIIEPQSGRAERQPLSQATGRGHICESSLASIVKQPVLPNAGHQDVRKPVVVIV